MIILFSTYVFVLGLINPDLDAPHLPQLLGFLPFGVLPNGQLDPVGFHLAINFVWRRQTENNLLFSDDKFSLTHCLMTINENNSLFGRQSKETHLSIFYLDFLCL